MICKNWRRPYEQQRGRNRCAYHPINLEQWLQSLNRSYTTLEQAAVHHGRGNSSVAMDSDVTFLRGFYVESDFSRG